MKLKAKTKTVILIALGIIFVSPIIAMNLIFITGDSNITSEYDEDFNLDNKNLQISAVSGKIHIDNNWTAAKAAGICTGFGTLSNPYIIEDLEIDGGGSDYCIWIENSNVYFKIENCTLYNSSSGIELSSVNNSRLIDNNCSANTFGIAIVGSYLHRSINNYLFGNEMSYNNFGIIVQNSNNNTLFMNVANLNHNDGIAVINSENNTFLENTANYNGRNGINSWQNTLYSRFIGNNVSYNNDTGLSLNDESHNNIIRENEVKSNYAGITLEDSNYNRISKNNVKNNTRPGLDYLNNYNKGIYLRYSDYNTLIDNILEEGRVGIGLSLSSFNNITGNTVSNTTSTGIGSEDYGDYGNNNKFIRNTIYYSEYTGMKLWGNNFIVSENIANYHYDYGILVSGDNNTVERNSAYNNTDSGIRLNGDNYSVTGNIANFNGYRGIRITVDNSNISDNIANFNDEEGVNINGDNNTASGNTANNNVGGGIVVTGDNNTLTQNSANYNTGSGISLLGGRYNSILSNTANENIIRGIHMDGSDFNIISNNTVNSNQDGIYMYYSDKNIVSGNTANYNNNGIHLDHSDNNTISDNNLIENTVCIYEYLSSYNIFENNDCGNVGPDQPVVPGYNLFFLLSILSVSAIILNKKLKKS